MKFSILTACHNKAKFIMACITSVLRQTYKNWELIIVDDFSTDESNKLLQSVKNHPQVKLIRNESRLFCSSTYAVALKHAQGDLCGILDGDDILDIDAVNTIVDCYKRHPNIDFIYTQHYWCNKALGNPHKGVSSLPKDNKSIVDMVLSQRHCFSHWRTFRRKLADKGTLFPEGLKFSVDKNLGFTLEELGAGAFLPKKLYFYRYYKGNMSLVHGSNQKQVTRRLAKQRKADREQNNIKVFPIIKIK